MLWVFIRKVAFGGPVEPGLAEFVAQMIAAPPRWSVIADFYPALMSHDKLAATAQPQPDARGDRLR